jgi:hypothetical protein
MPTQERQKYNSICVDSQGRQFEYGTIQGEYTPIDEVGGGCSTACVEGVSSDQARGCYQRPPCILMVRYLYLERELCEAFLSLEKVSSSSSHNFSPTLTKASSLLFLLLLCH